VDLQFHAAYQAAFRLATIVLAASKLRTAQTRHHWTTFHILPELGAQYRELADYFDQCRGKRNVADYDRAGDIAETEARELLAEAKKFRGVVLAWLRDKHPTLVP